MARDNSVGRGIWDYLRDLFHVVIYRPIRYGTLALGEHSIPGIAWAVTVLYAITVASILLANPLRAASPLDSVINDTGNIVVPAFLIPAVLCLIALSFALLLAGSQRSPWWRRILYLIVVGGSLTSTAAICTGFGGPGLLAWAAWGMLALTLLYVVVMWTGRTPPGLDVLVLVLLCAGIFLVSYRSLVTLAFTTQDSPELITTALTLGYLGSLALPVAFLAGMSATAFGVSILSWGGEEAVSRAGAIVGGVILGVLLLWQWNSFLQGFGSGVLEFIGSLLAALLVLILCALAWWACTRNAVQRDSSPLAVTAASLTVAVPVAYAISAPAIIGAVLGQAGVAFASLLPGPIYEALSGMLTLAGSSVFVTLTRALTVAGLAVGAAVLVRRGRAMIAAVAAVSAVVLGTFFWLGRVLGGILWTPSTIGDIGILAATLLVILWAFQRSLDRRRLSFLVLLALLSALVRQADFFAVPVGFIIGASSVALLIVGLIWGFLIDGGEVHEDAPGFPRDRRLLVLLGTFLFSVTIVAWAVIGKDVGTVRVLAGTTTLAVQTLGTAMIIALVLEAGFALWRIRRAPEIPVAAAAEGTTFP